MAIEGVRDLTEAIRNRNTEILGDIFAPTYNGTTYYVDGNYGEDGRTGMSWEKPLKTLNEAFARSHLDMARGADRYARRNRVYACGDEFSDTLITSPQKTDIIGVGSDNGYPMAGLKGNHAPVNSAMGTRWFNFRFLPVTANPIFTLGATSGNPEYHYCQFDASGDLIATTAITATACARLKVKNCELIGDTSGFSTAAISIAAGEAVGISIEKNTIFSESIGILIASHTGKDCWLKENWIKSTGICISAASTVFHVVGNRCITLNAAGTAGAGAIICNQFLSNDNRLTCSDLAFTYPLLGEDANGQTG
jgi:hypothetical protein